MDIWRPDVGEEYSPKRLQMMEDLEIIGYVPKLTALWLTKFLKRLQQITAIKQSSKASVWIEVVE